MTGSAKGRLHAPSAPPLLKPIPITCVCDIVQFLDGWEGCCTSCHDDVFYGWGDLIEHRIRDQWVEVCCRVSNAFFPEGEHDDQNPQCACIGCMALVKPRIRASRVAVNSCRPGGALARSDRERLMEQVLRADAGNRRASH